MENPKADFLGRYNPHGCKKLAVALALRAALQRNPTYLPGVSFQERKNFRDSWGKLLQAKESKYERRQTVAEYEKDIEELKIEMNKDFRGIFCDEGFKISHAQKSLGVFLKHLWCMGEIAIPPQCPVDRRVLEMAGDSNPSWTSVNSIADHRAKIAILEQAKAADQPLAEWELRCFNDNGGKAKDIGKSPGKANRRKEPITLERLRDAYPEAYE